MSSQITIAGLAELKRQLDGLPARIERNVMRGALRAGQKVMLDAARNEAPRDDGDLQASIRIRNARKSEKFGWVRSHLVAGNAKAWYANLIEYGTASYYIGKGNSKRQPYKIEPRNKQGLFFNGVVRESVTHPGIKPNPFMRRTFDRHQDAALQATVNYLKTRIALEIAKHA